MDHLPGNMRQPAAGVSDPCETPPAGYFRAGKRHGLGKAVYGDGTKYEGEWADGVRSGQGTCLYANGDKYQGESARRGCGTALC